MGTAPTMKSEEQPMKREGQSTKREGQSTKSIPRFYRADGITFSGDDGTIFPEATGPWSNSGAPGDYTVRVTDGDPVTIAGAITIRVLHHGELNLLTDAGRWYLFAPGTWKTAFPKQPEPGV